MAAMRWKRSGAALTAAVRLLFLLLLSGPALGGARSELGRWPVTVGSDRLQTRFPLRKTMFNNTLIFLKLAHDACVTPVNLSIAWYLRTSRCYDEFFEMNDEAARKYFNSSKEEVKGGEGSYVTHPSSFMECDKKTLRGQLELKSCEQPIKLKPFAKSPEKEVTPTDDKKAHATVSTVTASGKQKAAAHQKGGGSESQTRATNSSCVAQGAVAQTWEDAPYLFILEVQVKGQSSGSSDNSNWRLTLEVDMIGPYGYISATEWPLMIFYMVMCIVYVLYSAVWLLLLVWYWRELLRIQYWIGGVILLGMLEKAVFYAEFQSIRYQGVSVNGAVVFAELLSALKRTLARTLVILAALGYGIVKPRLGSTSNQVVGIGVLYLLFSSVEGVLRVTVENPGRAMTICEISLALIDSCIVWWIFISLSQTMKLLKLRRNLVKLSLYRHFTNILIFAVITSIIFIIWATKTFRFTDCQSDWREMWIQDGFWRFLFSILLLVIMFLWRPSANNQRYAYSPLVDECDDDEEGEQLISEAFEGMKIRTIKSESNGLGAGKPNRMDEDLKWVEENIPSSLTDVALPTLLDSDEEIMMTKSEISKME
uniref:Transmembrane protein 87A n=1 Tax=Callorhinchus milii TaxID=7868 RepID=V9KND0_CALMI